MTIDITEVPIHLGLGGIARPVQNFDWSLESLAAYDAATRSDGPDGRLVMMFHSVGAWDSWEQHPVGEEVVIVCSGTHLFKQEIDGEIRELEAGPGQAIVNPPGVWHTADSGEGGILLTITPGLGTEHRPA